MILYTTMAKELVLEGFEDNVPEYEEIHGLGGIILQVEPLGFGQAKIVRLISSNPEDYLNPAFQPGQVITYSISLIE